MLKLRNGVRRVAMVGAAAAMVMAGMTQAAQASPAATNSCAATQTNFLNSSFVLDNCLSGGRAHYRINSGAGYTKTEAQVHVSGEQGDWLLTAWGGNSIDEGDLPRAVTRFKICVYAWIVWPTPREVGSCSNEISVD
ncbi:hypothetical protein [Kribbella sp. NPDC051770]|uniref:hypothetical protein n=1 Tax=Kribbella sp. NPDC051770 TaxID=3155413 RepID=UPI00341941AA